MPPFKLFSTARSYSLGLIKYIFYTTGYIYNFTHACISSVVFYKSTPVGYLYFLGWHLYKYKSFFYLLSSVSSNTT
jgi:hypothetical protein